MTDLNNFRYKLSLQFLGILVWKAQLWTMWYLLTNKKFIPLHLFMKTALSLNFKQTSTYLAIKIELVKRRGFDTYKTSKKKEEHKEKTVFTASGDDWRWIHRRGWGSASYNSLNILLFLMQNCTLTTTKIFNSNGLYAHKSLFSNNFKSILTDYKRVLHCEGYDYEEDPENLLEGLFFTRWMKFYSWPDGFMSCGKLGIDLQHRSYSIQLVETMNQTNSSATIFLLDKREF